ncbi:putative ATP-dependent DNA helicase [Gordonia effusa NBRC 100432]|uniref:DNA 3'-5' helicase n=1 Tax=Gordonia effusa NBRC 100432 TaxID=1077974 RepID=H0QUG9_9ACTN|nr:ATP-dependent DNA helicase [Gordonia effusa]GAB16470.1 putative ATP-dependent DNA helicase [Gordonia effusa NBRC 100432]
MAGTALRTRLVSTTAEVGEPRRWVPAAQHIISTMVLSDPERPWLPYRVHGGPGTGKTSLIVDAAVERLSNPDVDPESVLVLASSRRAATALREQITRLVLARGTADDAVPHRKILGGALREPLVRTVHSYAFAILRLQAAVHDNPPPRLITGSEQDVVLRELLMGDLEDGAEYWPTWLRPALTTDGFAQALRDLLMRAAERGVGPEELMRLGRAHKHPEWVAAGHAYAQYEQNMLLRGAVGIAAPHASAPAVDAAELVGSALSAFATDPELLAVQRNRIRHLLVDDAQHLDPQAAQLIRLIGTGADSAIIAADTDQSIFSFRGASPRFVESLTETGSPRDILLDNDFRGTPAINAVGAALARRLPGHRPHRYPEPISDDHGETARVRVFTSSAKEATAVADLLRRAHLFDDVPWSSMAVIVRSVALSAPALRRAFRSAGVPLTTPTSDLPLHRQRAVAAFLLALRVVDATSSSPAMGSAAVTDTVDADDLVTLLSGPIGGADPASLRRLRRGIRRIDEKAATGAEVDSLASLWRALTDPECADRYLALLSDVEARPLRRTLDVVNAAVRVNSSHRGVEETLWAAWQASGLEKRWAASALRGGPVGEQSDRDLDAMVAMFEAAASFTDNLPTAGVGEFVRHLTALQIPRDSRVAHAAADSVTVLSAHAAAGREWDVVAVAGVLDGLWPSLRSRGSVLATGQLMDILEGIDPDAVDTVARSSIALADERRLLLVACTRARRRLLVSAVEDGSGESSPSRFIPEIASALGQLGTDDSGETQTDTVELDPGVGRVLSLPSLIATLRSEVAAGVAAGAVPDARTRAAAELLAQLADSDIPGAHPRDWFGLAGPSTDSPLWTPEAGPRFLSPSNVESLSRCSLRWVLERHGGRDGNAAPALTGTLVHTLVQAVAGQIAPAEVTQALREIWDRVDSGADWYSAKELERAEGMLTNFREWLAQSRSELTVHGVETAVDAHLPADVDDPTSIPVRLVGRIDRLETDSAGRPVVVDVKTGKTVISANDAADHAQLATYQLALTLGGVPELGAVETGGARLVYVAQTNRKTGAAVREQDALTPDLVDEWKAILRAAAKASVGPVFTATVNPGCGHCQLSTSCPARLRGKSVVDD